MNIYIGKLVYFKPNAFGLIGNTLGVVRDCDPTTNSADIFFFTPGTHEHPSAVTREYKTSSLLPVPAGEHKTPKAKALYEFIGQLALGYAQAAAKTGDRSSVRFNHFEARKLWRIYDRYFTMVTEW